ncbi:MAG: hypothetical protein HQ562_05675 [Candidatus Marinimicrobia bacterium]|nr:hypothetical protein [Candidatus Neomarinimicrobiota bacterium]
MDLNIKTFPNEVWVKGIKGEPIVLESGKGERLAIQENEQGVFELMMVSDWSAESTNG